jgi:3-oxoacyl-[acyl-carrier protein] reductase
MNLNLTGKHAIICGSTQGIGRACAHELAGLGARMTLIARNERALEKVIDELLGLVDEKHDFICADFSTPDILREKLDAYLHTNKSTPAHILVNNTGGPSPGPVSEASISEFDEACKKHLVCNHILAQAVLPGMKAGKYGRIINIISTSVKQPIKGLGVSNTIRGAVANWAKTLAGEVASFGVTVNNVLPGSTNTARLQALMKENAEKSGQTVQQIIEKMLTEIPVGRIAEPEEIAAAVAFLASPAAGYINGINLPVDGGRTLCL